MTAMTLDATTLMCPDAEATAEQARPQGLNRLVMVLGMGLATWAQGRADRKAMRRRRSPLSALSAHEQAQLVREAILLREQAYAERSRWHVTG